MSAFPELCVDELLDLRSHLLHFAPTRRLGGLDAERHVHLLRWARCDAVRALLLLFLHPPLPSAFSSLSKSPRTLSATSPRVHSCSLAIRSFRSYCTHARVQARLSARAPRTRPYVCPKGDLRRESGGIKGAGDCPDESRADRHQWLQGSDGKSSRIHKCCVPNFLRTLDELRGSSFSATQARNQQYVVKDPAQAENLGKQFIFTNLARCALEPHLSLARLVNSRPRALQDSGAFDEGAAGV